MIEIAIHGRGGRGGVTLAKLIAAAHFGRGDHVQAFGLYGAERTGAPVQAFVRIDSSPVTVHGAVQNPDHVVVLDPSLVTPDVVRAADPRGWVIINSPTAPEAFAEMLPGRTLAVVDASRIAVAGRLGTRTIPIVNTAMLGSVLRVLGLSFADVEAALQGAGFGGPNIEAAAAAFDSVRTARLAGTPASDGPIAVPAGIRFFDDRVGGPPVTRTGDWASRWPRGRELAAPCSSACPAGNDVRGFVRAAARGDREAALATILRTSPFPATCGRVCPAPCTANCNRAGLDEAINVRELERGVERAAQRPPAAPQPAEGDRVAVIGSGPAGLSAAYHLARLGYAVTVYEKDRELGGVLRTGIPAYRLPREALERDIAYILDHGVGVKPGRYVDEAELERLRHDHRAVLVATGLPVPKALSLAEASAGETLLGVTFLDAVRRGGQRLDGRRVVVVGGGNTAVDSARTALRLGARDVRLAYRRTRDEMPAIDEEVEAALAEGVELSELVSPARLRDAGGQAVLECERMAPGPPDETGRRSVRPADDGSVVDLACDVLVLAVGQVSDLPVGIEDDACGSCGNGSGDRGMVVVCGDAATGEGTVAAAIGSGRAAALRVHHELGGAAGESLEPRRADELGPPAGLADIDLRAFAPALRLRGDELPPGARRTSFAEVCSGIEDTHGLDGLDAEASRCFSCGSCSACGLCLEFCPEGVVHITDDGRFVADEEYCKGCGLCASVCPRGALAMGRVAVREEVRT
jgi:2-oxoacid:acceptor oxidoreductase gamma subunit (pyruvate/2-ketoisovalerate family)